MKSAGVKAAGISTPSNNDVLFGRGPKVQSHSGNVNYRRLVESRRIQYIQTKRTHVKDSLARQIYSIVSEMTPPGRFLRKETDGLYYIQDEAVTIVKIKQALRENSVATKDKIEIASVGKKTRGYPPHSLDNIVREETNVMKVPSSLWYPPPLPNMQLYNGDRRPAAAQLSTHENVAVPSGIKSSPKRDVIDRDMDRVVELLLKASSDSADSHNKKQMRK